MTVERLTEEELARAMQIWADYQKQHDLSDRKGQAAGIDPFSGRVWFGESARDIYYQRRAEGIETVFFCARVGSPTYLRKGGRR